MKTLFHFLAVLPIVMMASCNSSDEPLDPTKFTKEIDKSVLEGFISGEVSSTYKAVEIHYYKLNGIDAQWECVDDNRELVGWYWVGYYPRTINISEGCFWLENNYKNLWEYYFHGELFGAWDRYRRDAEINENNLRCYIKSPVTKNVWDCLVDSYEVEIEKIGNTEIKLAFIMKYSSGQIYRDVVTYERKSDFMPAKYNVQVFNSFKERDAYMIDILDNYYGDKCVPSIDELRKQYL